MLRTTSRLHVGVLPTLEGESRPPRYWNPSWSPDGRTLLFEANLEGDAELDLWALRRDRASLERILDGVQQGQLSPDGSKLLYIQDLDGNLEIFVADADGSHPVNVSRDERDTYIPRWSPDGRSIAFVRRSKEGSRIHDLWVMSVDGTSRRRLTDPSANEIGLSWAPDGSEIAFGSDRDGDFELFAVTQEGGEPRRLTDHPARDSLPAWSPDGETIAFGSDRGGSTQVHLMDRNGDNVRRLTDLSGTAFMPAWSPDGEWLAFIGEDDGQRGVFVVRPDGSGLARLTPGI